MLKRITMLSCGLVFFASCSDESSSNEPLISVPVPAYSFERDGVSSVNFDDQAIQIAMAELVVDALKDETIEASTIENMFSNTGNPFGSREDLNDSDESVRAYTENPEDFEDFIDQLAEARINADPNGAAEGVPGTFLDQGVERFVTGEGMEIDQVFSKTLIGDLMMHQIFNKIAEIDIDNNEDIITEGNTSYTAMEHTWDEVFGYIFGAAINLQNPLATIGQDDSFLNEHIGRVDTDPDFAGVARDIFQALVTGREAIVKNDLATLDQQVRILRTSISRVVAARAIFHLQQSKNLLSDIANEPTAAFHNLSQAYGFVNSLQFARDENDAVLFSQQEVFDFIRTIEGRDRGNDHFWGIENDLEILDEISESIAEKFTFTVAQAASLD